MDIEKDISDIETYIPTEGEIDVLAGIGRVPVSLATDSFKEFIQTRDFTPSDEWRNVWNRVCRGVLTPEKLLNIIGILSTKAEGGDVKAIGLLTKIIENLGKEEEAVSKKEINVTISYSNEPTINQFSPQVSIGNAIEAAVIKDSIDG